MKNTVSRSSNEYGAWLPHEGPFVRKKHRVKIPLPTGNRPADEIIDRMVVGNSLEGLLTKIAEIQTEKALVIIAE